MASIERYLKQNFERRIIKEIKGSFLGPKKLKASGKAAGSKKKKTDKKTAEKKSTDKKASSAKKTAAKKPNAAKSKPAAAASSPRDGSAPLRRQPAV